MLQYMPDFDAARDRLTRWWNGEDIGRPALRMQVIRDEPWENIPKRPAPEGWLNDRHSIKDLDYRVHLALRHCIMHDWVAEGIPYISADVGPGSLALYLGCKGVEDAKTVWFEPCIDSPEDAVFRLDPENPYWQFTLRLAREQLRLGGTKFLTSFPDLIEGLDTLAAMRGTQTMLMDLIERPEWVHRALDRVADLYFEAYDSLYDLIKDDRGGSVFWVWAPGRVAKLQCDCSAMISPAMFSEFMIPHLTKLLDRLDYALYHWDGPLALKHHDHLLSLKRLQVLQWTPGAGADKPWDRKWWPYFHKTFDAGKKVCINIGRQCTLDGLRGMKQEFGANLKKFLLFVVRPNITEAQQLLAVLSD